MITLDNLRPTRTALGMSRPLLAAITNITDLRLRTVELRQSEPWFDEAVMFSRALCVPSIGSLITSGTLTLSAYGKGTDREVGIWRSGARVSLSLALRVANRFGLPTVDTLIATDVTREIWDIVGGNDRHPEYAGICPWCVADVGMGEDHKLTCLPNNLWRKPDRQVDAVEAPVGVFPKKKGRVPGIPARGLKAPRLAAGATQKDIAEILDVAPNYYARMERADVPFGLAHADKLAAHYGVDRETLYVGPGDDA